ncbi:MULTISPECIES: hypothetical protein [Mycobacteriaceae]|uniref:Uncharacterized protein n=1 Tax=Mycolicibacterium parafortuitum TaxID=39692 RepID=A0ACC6MMV5_MYCPF|nr:MULTISPECIES: hypothetical protein [Mycobacteriaceae]MDZ5088335.1 hypothetical protein [Mycolicibacterium parafortuitum]
MARFATVVTSVARRGATDERDTMFSPHRRPDAAALHRRTDAEVPHRRPDAAVAPRSRGAAQISAPQWLGEHRQYGF